MIAGRARRQGSQSGQHGDERHDDETVAALDVGHQETHMILRATCKRRAAHGIKISHGGRWHGTERALWGWAGTVLVLRDTRDWWRWLCDRQAVTACERSGCLQVRGCAGWWRRKGVVFGRDAGAGGGEVGEKAVGLQAGRIVGRGAGAGVLLLLRAAAGYWRLCRALLLLLVTGDCAEYSYYY